MDNKKPETVRDINPTDYITQFDLDDKDLTVQIADVQIDELPVAGTSKTQRRGVLIIKDAPVDKMVLNKTNIKVIANLYGGELSAWVGEWITIYRDPSIRFGPKKTGGIRVRPNKPARKSAPKVEPKQKQASGRTIADVMRGFDMAETLDELKRAWAAGNGIVDGSTAGEVTAAYKARLEQIKKTEADPNNFGPPALTDEDNAAIEGGSK